MEEKRLYLQHTDCHLWAERIEPGRWQVCFCHEVSGEREILRIQVQDQVVGGLKLKVTVGCEDPFRCLSAECAKRCAIITLERWLGAKLSEPLPEWENWSHKSEQEWREKLNSLGLHASYETFGAVKLAPQS